MYDFMIDFSKQINIVVNADFWKVIYFLVFCVTILFQKKQKSKTIKQNIHKKSRTKRHFINNSITDNKEPYIGSLSSWAR